MKRLPTPWAAMLLVPSLLRASHLPIRTYTTADGLARDHILAIAQDSHGFLWFGTAEGLSRFDGYQFTNYQVEQGLPSNVVDDFLETRGGVYWIATGGGLCRFDPAGAGASRFVRTPLGGASPATRPSVLYEDASGVVWCGAASGDGGLYRLDPKDGPSAASTSDGRPGRHRGPRRPAGRAVARRLDGVVRRDADGTTRRLTRADGLPERVRHGAARGSRGKRVGGDAGRPRPRGGRDGTRGPPRTRA